MNRFFLHTLVGVCLLLPLSPFTNFASGQQKPEVGEEVQVLHLGKWKDGVVLEADKDRARVEYKFINTKEDIFTRDKIRRMHEVDALDFDRKWASADGSFRIVAALKSYEDEKVKLIKTDLAEVTVPLDKLSRNDITYVKKLKRNIKKAVQSGDMPTPTPELPDIELFSDSDGTVASFSTFGESSEQTALGGTPDYLKTFAQQGVGFRKARSGHELVAVIPVGGPDQLVLMTFHEKGGSTPEKQFPSVLYWVSMKDKSVVATVNITHQQMALDYHPESKRLLTFSRARKGNIEEPPHYTVWDLAPKASEAKPVVRWEAGVSWSQKPYGKMINDRVVLTRTGKKEYQGYDIVEKQQLYSYKQNSFFSSPVALSKDRKHLVLPEDGQIRILNTTTGNVDLTLESGASRYSGANINADGTKVAGLNSSNVYVWDLKNKDSEPKVYSAPLIGTPFSARLEWLDDDSIFVDGRRRRTLYRLSIELPIWSYEMKVSGSANQDPLKSMVIAGKLFYVAEPDSKSIAIGAVDLPGPQVNEITKKIDKASLMLMKPGVHVAIDTSKANKPEIKGWLSEKVKANQWVEDPNAEIVLSAEMGRGKTETITYRRFGRRGHEAPQKASYRPYYARLKLTQGEKVVWSSNRSSSPPHMIKEGNIQQLVTAEMVPQTGHFERVKIDPLIIDPKYSRGFGVSTLGISGIKVTSTSPPGRTDDPANDVQDEGGEDEQNPDAQ